MRHLTPLLAVLLLAGPVRAADSDGADHAALPRYPGAEIANYRGASVDNIFLPTATVAAEARAAGQALSGNVTHIDYRITPAIGALGVARHYEGVLQSGGFRILFACAGIDRCGRDMGSLILNSGRVAPTGFADGIFRDGLRVIVAERGATKVLLHIVEGPDRTLVYEAVVDDTAVDTASS